MATEISSIGIAVETDGVERGIRSLQALAKQGPAVERSMDGIQASIGKANNALGGMGSGADAGLRKVGSAANSAKRDLDGLASSASNASKSVNFDQMVKGIEGLGQSSKSSFKFVSAGADEASAAVDKLKQALAFVGVGFGVKSVIDLADGYTKFTAQLRLASDSAQDYASAMSAVHRISTGAQQGLGEVGTLYARISTSTKELGISQQRVADITETVALSLKANGASASEASSAMLQLSQAFGSGVLRGEEFNAVYEAAPNLLRNLAASMQVPVGSLREMASNGELTAKVLAEHLPNALAKVRKEAEAMQTIGGSFVTLKNNLMLFTGETDKAVGATKAISGGVLAVANNLDIAATALGGISLIMAGRYVGATVAANASTIALAASTARANIAAVALAGSLSPAAAAMGIFGASARGASGAMALLGGPVGLAVTAIGAAAAAFLYFRDSSEEAVKAIGGLSQPLDDLKAKLDALPPEKRVSVIIDIEKQGKESIKTAESDIESLVQSIAGAANIKMPLDEFENLTSGIRDSANAGDDLTPALKRAAEAGNVPQTVLQKWLQLASNIREAQAAASNAASMIAASAPQVGGDFAAVFPSKSKAEANAEAAAALKSASAYKSKAEQMAEVRKQGDGLRSALKSLTETNQGTSKSADELRARLVGVDEKLTSMSKSGRSAASGAKTAESAYASLSKRVGDYAEQLRIEALQGDKATTAQKLQIQLNDLLANSKEKISAAKVYGLQADIQSALAMEVEAKATKRAVDQAEEAVKAYDSLLDSTEKRADSIRRQAQSEVDAAAAIGVSKDAIAELEAAKYRELAVSLERRAVVMDDIDLSGQQSAAIRAEAQAYKELASAKIQRGIKQANYDTAKQAEKDWEKVSETIGRSLSDYIMGGGKDAATYLKRLFSTLVLQPIVNTAVGAIFGTGASGGAAGGQNALSALNNVSSIASFATNAKNYFSVATQFFKGGMSGANAAGTLYANASGTGLNGLIASQGGWGTASGGAASGIGKMAASAWPAAIIAGMFASSKLYDSGISHKSFEGFGKVLGAVTKLETSILSKIVGNKTANILTGAPVMAYTLNKLFGRTLKDAGIEGTFGGEQGFTGNTFEYYKGGLFRSNKTTRGTLDEGNRQELATQYMDIRSSVKGMGDALGLITGAVDSATYSIKLSLKGLSSEDSAKLIQAEFERITESMAGLILVTGEYSLAEEKRIETMVRLSGSLSAFNESLDQLGLSAYDASLKSADAAYKIITAFGGLESYGAAVQGYYQNFYSEEEKLAKITDTVTESLAKYGAALPESAEAYRAMVESQLAAAQYGDEKAAEFAASLIAISGDFKFIADAWKKELEGMASEVSSVFAGIKDEIASVLSDVANTRESIIRGTGAMTAAEIQAAINAALIYAPSTAESNSAYYKKQEAALSLSSAKGRYELTSSNAKSAQGNADVANAQLQELINKKGSLEYSIDDINRHVYGLWNGGKDSGYRTSTKQKWTDDFMKQVAGMQSEIESLNPSISAWTNEVARLNAIAAQANAIASNDANALAAAQEALKAAEKADIQAKADYAEKMRKFVADASGSVGKLSNLRGEVVAFYESQAQAIQDMLQSASNIRSVVDSVRLGQLNSAQTARELGNRYAMDYSMALATTGTTRAGYVDAMAGNLQALTDAIKVEAVSSSDWQIQTAKLLAQATNAAGLLEGDAEADDYQETALGLLDSIDSALKNLESVTKTGEQMIADAVNNGSASNLNGLRAIVAALKGEPIPAFAVGTNFVPRDMIAQIHEGEAIVPKAFNPWAGGAIPSSGNSDNREMESLVRQLIEEQRVQAARTVELLMQMNKREDRWDAMGMPEVREV